MSVFLFRLISILRVKSIVFHRTLPSTCQLSPFHFYDILTNLQSILPFQNRYNGTLSNSQNSCKRQTLTHQTRPTLLRDNNNPHKTRKSNHQSQKQRPRNSLSKHPTRL